MTGVYSMAGRTIEISTLHGAVHTMCKAYRAGDDCRPDFSVVTGQKEIDFERERSAQLCMAAGEPVPQYSDVYLELTAVCRAVSERMPEYDTFLFHGSAVAVDGDSYVFTAKSGTGKSTHARLWRELLGERVVMVNDDKPLIRVTETGALACGSPWDGKHHLSNNIAVPIRAVCILERAEENQIREITREEALPMMVQQAYRPFDPVAMALTMSLIDRMNVKFYRLGCNMDIIAAELSYQTMKG